MRPDINAQPTLPFDNPTAQPEVDEVRQVDFAVGRGDRHLWGIYIFLVCISIIELYSASSREISADSSFGVLGPVVRHIGILLVGFVCLWFLQSRHYKWILKWSPVFILVTVGMMVWVLFFGKEINGAVRQLSIFGFMIAPAEFAKLSAVLVVSFIMARSQLSRSVGVSNRGVWLSALAIVVLGALMIKNGGTNTILLMAIALSMMLIGGARIVKQWGAVLGAFTILVALYVGLMMLMPEEEARPVTEMRVLADGSVEQVEAMSDSKAGGRVETWGGRFARYFSGDTIPKYRQPINALNRQEMYAYMAQANGGIFPQMPGNSRESSRLPLAFSDFIFSIVVEDLGLIGGLFVLVAYLWLLGRASGIASRCSRAYPALLVIGMAVMIVYQALIHMAIVTGAAPVSGQPLPLISKGGSSILVTSIAFGIMLSVSKYAVSHRQKRTLIKNEIATLPEDFRAENPGQL